MPDTSKYEIIDKLITKDNFSIYRGIKKSNNQTYILNTLNTNTYSEEEVQLLNNKYNEIKNLSFDKILKVNDFSKINNNISLETENFEGITLKNFLKINQISIIDFLEIALKITRVLEKIHKENIVLKSLNPELILINPQNKEVEFFDLISFFNQTIHSNITDILKYISPEQTGRINKNVDYRTDFYSLGITFYEIITGKTPFETDDTIEIIHSHIAKEPIPPNKVNKNLPLAISNIIMKLISKNTEDRYQSAKGLIYDLEYCLETLNKGEKINFFQAGKYESSTLLDISTKMYGRENFIYKLKHVYKKVCEGNKEIVLISGESGEGKTTLIHNFERILLSENSYFIKGKFEHLKTNTPFFSLIEAFKELIKKVLTESQEHINYLKKRIIDELGENTQIIINMIPELKLIVDKRFQLYDLDPRESQNRFNMVFQKFISIFSQKEHPLIIVLDDLQWADPSSYSLLNSLLTDSNFNYCMFIITYRNNDKYNNSFLDNTIRNLRYSKINLTEIRLYPLQVEDIKNMLKDTFLDTSNKIDTLSEIIYLKTGGNPFFITEFLKFLYQNKIITYEIKKGWIWDIEKIEESEFTQNIVQLMLEKFNKLPENIKSLLKTASCIGSNFGIDNLSVIQGLPKEEVFSILNSEENKGILNLTEKSQSFLHEKIQETIYSTIPELEKKEIHFKIGKKLFENTDKEKLEELIFDIVNQLNFGIEFAKNDQEKLDIANLNLIAGKKAKKTNAYKPALKYLKNGLKILPENSWKKNYKLTFDIYIEYAECQFLLTNFEESEKLFDEILIHSKSKIEKAKVYEIKIILYTTMNKIKEAFTTSKKALKLFNISLPEKGLNLNLLTLNEFIKVYAKLKLVKISNLPNLPVMNKEDKIQIMKILMSVAPSIYMTNNTLLVLIILKMVNISLKFGNSDVSAYSYLAFAMIVSDGLKKYPEGYHLGKIALEINEKFNNNKIKCKVNFIFSALVSHWKNHLKEDINILKNTYSYGLETGDLQYSGYALNHILIKMFSSGENLNEISSFAKNNQSFIIKTKDQNVIEIFNFRLQSIINLKGINNFNEIVNEEDYLKNIYKTNNNSNISYALITKMQLEYYFENYGEALITSFEAQKYLSGSFGTILIPEFYFYSSLIITILFNKLPKTDKKKLNITLNKNLKRLERLSNENPSNFKHKYLLLLAEICRINSQNEQAIKTYIESILHAEKFDFIHEQALACELLSKFFETVDDYINAKDYILKAYNLYQKWGANAKLHLIEKKYSKYFQKSKSIENTHITKPLSETQFDYTTIMKASQTLSGEIFLDRLMDKLIKFMLENAGAQRGILLLKNEDKLFIEAQGSVETIKTELNSIPLQNSNIVCNSIINYVERTKSPVVLNDAVNEGIFTGDPYILKNKPQSILCVPILNQTKLTGVFYLENNLSTEVFTSERVEILKLLSSQAAISLENAKLYNVMRELNKELEVHKNNLEVIVNKRTKQLKLTQKKLLETAHSSGMAEIATGVLHNIGNLINSVNISSQIISDIFNNSKIQGIFKANELLKENINNLNDFIVNNPKGHKLMQYYISIGDILQKEYENYNTEIQNLSNKISIIKDVISTQQTYAKSNYFSEKINPINLVEDALSLQLESLIKRGIRIKKYYGNVTEISVQKSKLMNVIVNLIKNSEEALENTPKNKRKIIIKIAKSKNEKAIVIKVMDNGEGIPKDNLKKIFTHGFTTKKKGHGFGLHICANSMTEIGGKLSAYSKGEGKGAIFTVIIPINTHNESEIQNYAINEV